jgi:cation diffusion facilitator CzcD-associated flavoprotein CzcO
MPAIFRSGNLAMSFPDAIVIGAGPAGLAAAQQLQANGLSTLVLEKASTVGSVWRRHYDRLHLHTPRGLSGLPDLPMPTSFGRYPSRDQVVGYLERYAATFNLKPVFNTPVAAVRRDGARWRVKAESHSVSAPVIVVATGLADFPFTPVWPGMGAFDGPILHSSAYRNAAPFTGKRVLVIGFGNSGAEIALDLAEGGVDVAVSVRGGVNVLPRELLGVSIVSIAVAQRRTPPRLSDFLSRPPLRLAVGSLESLGLQRAAKGPRQSATEDGRIPVIDVGTLAMIRAGRIRTRRGVERFTPKGVIFANGVAEPFEAVILATGFRPNLRALLPEAGDVLDDQGRPIVSDAPTAVPGLYFCGAIPRPTGQLREIRLGAARIAAHARQLIGERR